MYRLLLLTLYSLSYRLINSNFSCAVRAMFSNAYTSRVNSRWTKIKKTEQKNRRRLGRTGTVRRLLSHEFKQNENQKNWKKKTKQKETKQIMNIRKITCTHTPDIPHFVYIPILYNILNIYRYTHASGVGLLFPNDRDGGCSRRTKFVLHILYFVHKRVLRVKHIYYRHSDRF